MTPATARTIPRVAVTPNKRGLRSRELVLDAAERVMATQGYENAALTTLVAEAGVPVSSVYHYFGSKDGVLLAVMERGASRFFDSLPTASARVGTPEAHLQGVVRDVIAALDRNSDFLRLVLVMATQPPVGETQLAHEVVTRVRERALRGLRAQIAIAVGRRRDSAATDQLARFALSAIDGAFVAHISDRVALKRTLAPLAPALVAADAALRR